MNALLMLCVLINCNKMINDTCFKYISTQDTIIVRKSDIVKIDSNWCWSFFVNDQVAAELSTIKDMSGKLYYFCEYQRCWMLLPQMRWKDSAVPIGWYVRLNKSGGIMYNNQAIVMCFVRLDNKKGCSCKKMLSRKRIKQIRKLSRKN